MANKTSNLAIDKFIEAIENGFYVEAHELLEDEWKEYKKQEKKKKAKAVQGLINGATALALYYIKKRPEAYKKVWPVFIKYKPLLDEVDLSNNYKYKQAADILESINNNIHI